MVKKKKKFHQLISDKRSGQILEENVKFEGLTSHFSILFGKFTTMTVNRAVTGDRRPQCVCVAGTSRTEQPSDSQRLVRRSFWPLGWESRTSRSPSPTSTCWKAAAQRCRPPCGPPAHPLSTRPAWSTYPSVCWVSGSEQDLVALQPH